LKPSGRFGPVSRHARYRKGASRELFLPNVFIDLDEPVKSQKPDGFEKSSSYGAQISAA
jgi:hypothetical protein